MKSKLIKTDGSQTIITPINGKEFSLGEIQNFVDGYVEIIQLGKSKKMYVNEEGLLAKLPMNEVASNLAGQPIVGNVLVIED